MKLLVATTETQGQRKNDFNWMAEGEPVYIGMTCDGATADDHCGCARAWTGLATRKAGTTAKVIDKPDMTPLGFRTAYCLALKDAGWDAIPDKDLLAMADEMIRLAAAFEPGMIVEHRNTSIQERIPKAEICGCGAKPRHSKAAHRRAEERRLAAAAADASRVTGSR